MAFRMVISNRGYSSRLPSPYPEAEERKAMTSFVLKNPTARSLLAQVDEILGSQHLKTGRFWYKSQQTCDLILLRTGATRIIYASGGLRFRLSLTEQDNEASGSLSLLGWLRETPNSIRIVRSVLSDHADEVLRRRRLKEQMLAAAERSGEPFPELTEAMGMHFSVKADESRLEEPHRISELESDRNFAVAVRTRWYHQGFVNFCKQHLVKCYYRSVFADQVSLITSQDSVFTEDSPYAQPVH
jgi:hypothetical protein